MSSGGQDGSGEAACSIPVPRGIDGCAAGTGDAGTEVGLYGARNWGGVAVGGEATESRTALAVSRTLSHAVEGGGGVAGRTVGLLVVPTPGHP